MTFNPCLPRLSSKAGLSQGGSKALTCQIFTSGDNHVCRRYCGRPRKGGKGGKEDQLGKSGWANPRDPTPMQPPSPWLVARIHRRAAAVNQLTPASTAVNQLTPVSTAVTSLQLSQKLGGVETAHGFLARPPRQAWPGYYGD